MLFVLVCFEGYYGGREQIEKDYGAICGYVNPKEKLVGSIMSKSDTGGGGRGGFSGSIIGDVIFHGKKKYWKRDADYHYHHLLKAGESTLEISLMKRVISVLNTNSGEFNSDNIRKDYIEFMTTKDSHNDTYCGTCHRMFFSNLMSGIDPKLCPDNDGHNVDTIDSIVTTIPVAFLTQDEEQSKNQIGQMVAITRDSKSSQAFAQLFGTLIRQVVYNAPKEDNNMSHLRAVTTTVAEKLGFKLSLQAPDPLTACYLSSAFPSVLQMVFKYSASSQDPAAAFRNGVLANANRGGENVGSGALIGALLGASCGYSKLPEDFVNGLKNRKEIEDQIDELLKVLSHI